MDLSGIEGVLLDLEGTLVADKRYAPIEGVPEWFRKIKARGRTALQTNNTTESPERLRALLAAGGMEFDEGMVISPLTVLGSRLAARPGTRFFRLGGEAVAEAAVGAGGASAVEPESAEVVILGLTPKLCYEDLKRGVTALVNGAELWALHYNRMYLDMDGRRGPSVGAVSRCLEYAAAVEAETLGKPSDAFFDLAEQRIGLAPERLLFVSDDPFADLTAAKRRGMATAFVLCGKYDDESVLERIEPELRPDITVRSTALLDHGLF